MDGIYPNNAINCTLKFCDVDFDGNKDILIYLGAYGNQGVEYYDCFLWNNQDEKYEHLEKFREIENPILSPSKKYIYSSIRISAAEYEYSTYKIQGRRLLKNKTLMVTYNSQGKVTYTEKTFNSKGIIIHEKKITKINVQKDWDFIME